MIKLIVKVDVNSSCEFVTHNGTEIKQEVRDKDKIIVWFYNLDEYLWSSSDSTKVLSIYIDDEEYNVFVYEHGCIGLFDGIITDIPLPEHEIYLPKSIKDKL